MRSTEKSLAHASSSSSSLKVSDLLEEMSLIKNELESAIDAEITSKKAMDDLALALKEVATDCNQTKEKLKIAETELEAARLESQQWKEKHEEVSKEAELLKNTSERLRIEAEESLLAWNGKESVFVSCIKRGEDEKNSLLEDLKKAKEENCKVRDVLKQAINEANVVRDENLDLKDALLDKEERLQVALKEIEVLKVNEAMGNENVKKLKKLLSETEKEKKESKKKELSLTHLNMDKKMIGRTCSFCIMKLSHHNHKEPMVKEQNNTKGGLVSQGSDSYDFKGSIFDVTETTPQVQSHQHHKRRSSCTFLDEVETINPEVLGGNQVEEGAASRKKKAFIRRFGDLLVRTKSFSFSNRKESQTPTSPSAAAVCGALKRIV